MTILQSRLNRPASRRSRLGRCWWLIVVALLVTWTRGWADEKDDEYLRIYDVVQQADALAAKNKDAEALGKYQSAYKALVKFKQEHADWNTKSVAFRLKYIGDKITELSEKVSKPAKPGSAGAATETGAPQLKLLEAGAEPRKVLRLHPKAGDKQSVGVTIKTATNVKVGEMENPPIKMPGMTLVLSLMVKEVAADGDITYESSVPEASVASDPDVVPQLAETLKASLDAIRGVSGTGSVSARGFSKASDFKLAPGANPQTVQAVEQMKQALSTLTIPLPEEAVGPGSKWEARSQIQSQGMTIDETATYELVSIEGERVVLKTTTLQSAANQKIENPAMPGVKMDLTKMEEKGTGNLTLDLTQLLPRDGSTTSHADFNMAINMGPQKQPMSMTIDTSMAIESK